MDKKLKAIERLMYFFDVLLAIVIILAILKAAVQFISDDWIMGIASIITDVITYIVLSIFKSRLKDVLMSIVVENYNPDKASIDKILTSDKDLPDYEREVLTEIKDLTTSIEILEYLRNRKQQIDDLIVDGYSENDDLFAEQNYLTAMIAKEENKHEKSE